MRAGPTKCRHATQTAGLPVVSMAIVNRCTLWLLAVLILHAVGFRHALRPCRYLAAEWQGQPQNELAYFLLNTTVDGLFDDFPGTAAAFLAQQTGSKDISLALEPQLGANPSTSWSGLQSPWTLNVAQRREVS